MAILTRDFGILARQDEFPTLSFKVLGWVLVEALNLEVPEDTDPCFPHFPPKKPSIICYHKPRN